MRDIAPFLPLDKYFQGLGLRGRIVMCQLPLSVTMLLVIILAGVLHPGLLQPGPFLYTLGPHLVLLGACALMPWKRLPARAFLVIPVLDCIAIGFSRQAADEYLTVLGFLLLFPVIWLSVGRHRSGVVTAVLATVLSAVLPILVLGSGFTGPSFIRIVMVPVILGAISLTAHMVSNAVLRQRLQLERQDARLQDLLTASKKRERLVSTILDTVGVGVCAVDEQGRKILMNQQQRSQFAGTLSEDPDVPGNAEVPVYGVDRSSPLAADQHPLRRAARGEPFTEELIWIGSGISQRAYSATCRLIRDDIGRSSGAVLAFTDVTALVSALSAKDQFVATVSHELRTPLTSILGYLGLALEEKPDLSPDLAQYLAVAQRNATRLLNLVTDLLSVASDTLTINTRSADLTEVIGLSVESASPRASAAGISLRLEPAGPVTGHFDPARIGQVIDNLLSNAIKYTPDGGTVTVLARRRGHHIECQVTDTGIGMNEEEQAQAFTRFFRAEQARLTAIPGAGLGLPITKSIIENHGGTITLASIPGKGTTVTLTLPVADTGSPQPAHPDAAAWTGR
jgi:signal transduction histidine kinase